MGKADNVKKNKALGMPYGTASNRLRKSILYALICQLELNLCYQCGAEITSISHLSIEHKEPWLQADDPVESFFDLSNIAFSHLKCNVAASGNPQYLNHATAEDERKHKNRVKRDWWSSLGKEEQRRQRRKSYLSCGK